MIFPIINQKRLFLRILKDRYDSETQQLSAIPKILPAISSQKLYSWLENSRYLSQKHTQKLESLAKRFDALPEGNICEGILGLINEMYSWMEDTRYSHLTDMVVVSFQKQICNIDYAGYKLLYSYACHTEDTPMLDILEEIMVDEFERDSQLDNLVHTVFSETKGHKTVAGNKSSLIF